MFTYHFDEFKTREKELHRQAEHFQMVKSLKGPNRLAASFYKSLGRMLILSGRQLINLTRAAAH